MARPTITETVTLDKIVTGGQALATLASGQKVFVWGGLPGETVEITITKKKAKLAEAIVSQVLSASPDRVEPLDEDSWLATSPWQIMSFNSELQHKQALIEEAFRLHHISLINQNPIISDQQAYHYRNKIEFSWYWNKSSEQLDLAFFQRGTKHKIPVQTSHLAKPRLNEGAIKIRNLLRQISSVRASDLKSLILRTNQQDQVIAQLYVKESDFPKFSAQQFLDLEILGLEIMFSEPKSPASVITQVLQTFGQNTLTDSLFNLNFNYRADSFFQINLPVYQLALTDIKNFVPVDSTILDLYSGVGTIGLTVAPKNLTLVEINQRAVQEMQKNIQENHLQAKAVLASSQQSLDLISNRACIIVDPPRAGLETAVVERLNYIKPPRIIYLSCNPTTQARDIANLLENYTIVHQQAYNFFPKTPHIENLIVLDQKN